MTMLNLKNIEIDIEPGAGEILQIWAKDTNAFLGFGKVDRKRKFVFLNASLATRLTFIDSVQKKDTVKNVIAGWLGSNTSICVNETLAAFEMEEEAEENVLESSPDVRLFLALLKTILEGAEILVLKNLSVAPKAVKTIISARKFAEKHTPKAGKVPAFIVLDEGDSVGFPLIADRILEPQPGGKWEELLVDF